MQKQTQRGEGRGGGKAIWSVRPNAKQPTTTAAWHVSLLVHVNVLIYPAAVPAVLAFVPFKIVLVRVRVRPSSLGRTFDGSHEYTRAACRTSRPPLRR